MPYVKISDGECSQEQCEAYRTLGEMEKIIVGRCPGCIAANVRVQRLSVGVRCKRKALAVSESTRQGRKGVANSIAVAGYH